MLTPTQFQKTLLRSVQKETSSTPQLWSKENPLFGHCAVVALLAQEIFGGELLRASLENTEFAASGSHYWNLLPDGKEQDFTQPQFQGRKPQLIGKPKTREYLLANDQTRLRYEQLKKAFLLNLSEALQ